jgi:SAM-dependent methyltransferase
MQGKGPGLSADLRRRWYELERRLADELRTASREERAEAYEDKYEVLFTFLRSVGYLQAETQFGELEYNIDLLKSIVRKPSSVLEIGSGTGNVALALAAMGHQVVASEIADTPLGILRQRVIGTSIRVVKANALTLQIPQEFDLVWSNDLIEHLHPEDARTHLQLVRTHLKPGGRYALVTPNKYSGPHDISAGFDKVPRGFHLKEWSYRELEAALLSAGFSRVRTVTLHSHVRWKIRRRIGSSSGSGSELRLGPTALRRWIEPLLRVPPFWKIASITGASAVTLIADR